MIFSLPSYRRLSDADLDRLRRDDDRNSSSRIPRILFNLLLLAGLWGVPLYARWMFLSDAAASQPLSEDVLGKWWKGEEDCLEFTPDQHLRLFRQGALIEIADYRIFGAMLLVSDFRRQDRLPVAAQQYQISIRGNQLTITPSTTRFTPIPENAALEGSALRLVLPPWQDATVQFRRSGKR